MLKKRIITALCLVAVLLLVLLSRSFFTFTLLIVVFFACAAWENARLFERQHPFVCAAIWTALFILLVFLIQMPVYRWISALAVAAWLYLIPSMFFSLPIKHSAQDRFFELTYSLAILGSFISVLFLYQYSETFLLSVLAIVWIADIGAYFAGRKFGKHKLAPAISPGKTWEGAAGGWVFVILAGGLTVLFSGLEGTIAVALYHALGWAGMIAVLTLLVALSIVGDLMESRLKRRRNFKDSSNLLPGHGGVLDRIDSLISVLPMAALFTLLV